MMKPKVTLASLQASINLCLNFFQHQGLILNYSQLWIWARIGPSIGLYLCFLFWWQAAKLFDWAVLMILMAIMKLFFFCWLVCHLGWIEGAENRFKQFVFSFLNILLRARTTSWCELLVVQRSQCTTSPCMSWPLNSELLLRIWTT